MYSDQLRFLSKLVNERQTAYSLLVESQGTTAERNRDDVNNFSQETPFLLFNRQFFSFKAHAHTHTLPTWLQQPAFLQVACSSLFYCYDAEESPSIGEATRRKIKLAFKNDLNTCLVISVDNILEIVCKRQRIRPFLNYWMNPVQPVTSTLTMTTQQEQSNNCNPLQITVHAQLLGHSFLGR